MPEKPQQPNGLQSNLADAPSRVYLVLQHDGATYVDSAWSTPEAAGRRITEIAASREAFRSYDPKSLQTLEVSLDAGGIAVHIAITADIGSVTQPDLFAPEPATVSQENPNADR